MTNEDHSTICEVGDATTGSGAFNADALAFFGCRHD
jgi:hypothetical protein